VVSLQGPWCDEQVPEVGVVIDMVVRDEHMRDITRRETESEQLWQDAIAAINDDELLTARNHVRRPRASDDDGGSSGSRQPRSGTAARWPPERLMDQCPVQPSWYREGPLAQERIQRLQRGGHAAGAIAASQRRLR
jgi:hypothetical protein